MAKKERFGNVDPAAGLANPNPETDVRHDGQSLAMPGVKQFYLMEDGSLAGQFHPELANGQMPKKPDMYTLKVEHITYHPATMIECWAKPVPWVFLTPEGFTPTKIIPLEDEATDANSDPDMEPDIKEDTEPEITEP